jgi:DNA replication and repair protein RecF
VAESRASVGALSLRDYRNFDRLELEFPAAGFVLIGENGQGKTNLLESIYYLSLLRSARGTRDVDVVRFGADAFHIQAAVCVPEPARIAVGFERSSKRKRVRRDDAIVDRLSDALGTLPVVLFSPEDVELVAGSPSARRRFLDIMLALTQRGYLNALQRYRGALERRNAALRDAARHPSRATAIEPWEPALVEHGATLIRAREAWVRGVAARFSERCRAIGESGRAELRYAACVEAADVTVEEALERAIAVKRPIDLRYGLTQAGPHRDDLTLLLDGRELRAFGSAGQQRTAAIALRTLEAETLRDARHASPVFLLDDPFAELDPGRAARVLALLTEVGLGQTVLAVPRDDDVPPELTSLRTFRVAAGTIQPRGSA